MMRPVDCDIMNMCVIPRATTKTVIQLHTLKHYEESKWNYKTFLVNPKEGKKQKKGTHRTNYR